MKKIEDKLIRKDIIKLLKRKIDNNKYIVNKRRFYDLFKSEYLFKYQTNENFSISFNRFNHIIINLNILSNRFKNKKKYKNYIFLKYKLESYE